MINFLVVRLIISKIERVKRRFVEIKSIGTYLGRGYYFTDSKGNRFMIYRSKRNIMYCYLPKYKGALGDIEANLILLISWLRII